MLHNILRQNAVNCVLKRHLTAVGPFSRNKSHMMATLAFNGLRNHWLFTLIEFFHILVWGTISYKDALSHSALKLPWNAWLNIFSAFMKKQTLSKKVHRSPGLQKTETHLTHLIYNWTAPHNCNMIGTGAQKLAKIEKRE